MTPFRIPVRQLAWATDLHLVFVPRGPLHAFCESLAQTSADAIAITGDISDGRRLERHLSLIAENVQKPIFVLLGNHDRYHTSFADAEEQVRRVGEIHRFAKQPGMRALLLRRMRGPEQGIATSVKLALDHPQPIHLIFGEMITTLPIAKMILHFGGRLARPIKVLEDEDRGQHSENQRGDAQLFAPAQRRWLGSLAALGSPVRTVHRAGQTWPLRLRQPWIAM